MTDNLEFCSPRDLAAKTGWSHRAIRAKARQIGACHVLGNRMILTTADVEAILEACRPQPTRRPAPPVRGDYAALVRLRDARKKR